MVQQADLPLSLYDLAISEGKRINPLSENAETIAIRFCQRLGIDLPYIHEYNTMSAYLFPTANLDRLLAIIMLNNLLFYIDDVYDRNNDSDINQKSKQQQFADVVDVFKTGQIKHEDNILEASAFAIRELFLPLANPIWLQRLIKNTEKHLDAAAFEDDTLSVQEYISIREDDSGMLPTVDLIEFANELYMDEKILSHPTIKAASQECIQIAALMNDLFSYEKECLRLGSKFNLISVMMAERSCTFDQALHHSVVLINKLLETFEARKDALPTFENEFTNQRVRYYYKCLEDQIIAAWHWQLSTNRYRSSESPFSELQTRL